MLKVVFFIVAFLFLVNSDTQAKPWGEDVSSVGGIGIRVINGNVASPNDPEYFPVVRVRIGSTGCSGTVIGPNVLITAAHCGRTGSTLSFTFQNASYKGVITRSRLYPRQDHDISLVKFSPTWKAPMVSVDVENRPAIGEYLEHAGFGDIYPGGGGSDGKMRYGWAQVTGFTTWDIVTYCQSCAAIAYGDSGGPTFFWQNGKKKQVCVNSKGNIATRSYTSILASQATKDFFKTFVEDNNVEICGFNKQCPN